MDSTSFVCGFTPATFASGLGQSTVFSEMEHVVGRGSRVALVWNLVASPPQFGMPLLVFPNGIERQPGLVEGLFKLRLGAPLGFGKYHLTTRQSVNFGITFYLDGSIEQVWIFADDVGHRADGHRVWHARVRRKFTNHVRLLVVIGIERLADQHMTFTAPQLEVIEGLGKLLQFYLIGQFARYPSQSPTEAVVGTDVETFQHLQQHFVALGMFARRMTMLELADQRVH